MSFSNANPDAALYRNPSMPLFIPRLHVEERCEEEQHEVAERKYQKRLHRQRVELTPEQLAEVPF